MEVQVLNKKLVKPSTPTPPGKTMKLSIFDQLTATEYMKVIFFFLSTDKNCNSEKFDTCNKLEKSLSEMLTVFYPLAGRLSMENLSVSCNDEGAEFLETQVNAELSQTIQGNLRPESLSRRLVPNYIESNTAPLVGVQVNKFRCGGLAVALTIPHRICDGFTISRFVDGWRKLCKGDESICMIKPRFDLGILFPYKNLGGQILLPPLKHKSQIASTRLVFDGAEIAKLKAKAKRKATRVDVVTAVIWRAQIKAARAKHGLLRPSSLVNIVNMRGNSQIPGIDNFCGNIFNIAVANFEADRGEIEFAHLLGLIKDAINRTKAENAKLKAGDDDFVSMLIKKRVKIAKQMGEGLDLRLFSSLSGFGAYEMDFGWGKPAWVGCLHVPIETVRLMDGRDGGIEAWITLDVSEMAHFLREIEISKSSFLVSQL